MRDYFQIGEFWVLQSDTNDGFLHIEDEVFTDQLYWAMKFDTLADARNHKNEMIEICRSEFINEERSGKWIYVSVLPRKVSISLV
jgi:hypothetical protein